VIVSINGQEINSEDILNISEDIRFRVFGMVINKKNGERLYFSQHQPHNMNPSDCAFTNQKYRDMGKQISDVISDRSSVTPELLYSATITILGFEYVVEITNPPQIIPCCIKQEIDKISNDIKSELDRHTKVMAGFAEKLKQLSNDLTKKD
jgi:hypothetical protein